MKYTVIARNITTEEVRILEEFQARSRKEANRASAGYLGKITSDEQLIVANPRQYEEFWRAAVETRHFRHRTN